LNPVAQSKKLDFRPVTLRKLLEGLGDPVSLWLTSWVKLTIFMVERNRVQQGNGPRRRRERSERRRVGLRSDRNDEEVRVRLLRAPSDGGLRGDWKHLRLVKALCLSTGAIPELSVGLIAVEMRCWMEG
jgi:hypothetical protein